MNSQFLKNLYRKRVGTLYQSYVLMIYTPDISFAVLPTIVSPQKAVDYLMCLQCIIYYLHYSGKYYLAILIVRVINKPVN